MAHPTTQSQPEYVIQKFRFPNHQAQDFSILFTANSSFSYMGSACLHGTREQVDLVITVPKVYRGWGIEAHLLFHIIKVLREESIQHVVVSGSHDEDLLKTLQAMGFDASSDEPQQQGALKQVI